jgi:hypothetical protein
VPPSAPSEVLTVRLFRVHPGARFFATGHRLRREVVSAPFVMLKIYGYLGGIGMRRALVTGIFGNGIPPRAGQHAK